MHCDVWTSPVLSNSGYKYYLVILDDYSHFTWTFPLRHKSDVLANLILFHAFVSTQFQLLVLSIQTDNNKEFDNSALRSFLSAHGVVLRLTCLYTSPQNGRAERVLRTLNDNMRALLYHTSMPTSFWPDALATTTYLLNRKLCRSRRNSIPFELLFRCRPKYDHLRTFGCLCYPNTAATTPHKLAPRSTACIFLGYPAESKGYRCYNPETRRVITSRHVLFDEALFPFRQQKQPNNITASLPQPEVSPIPVVSPVRARARTTRAAATNASLPPAPADPTPPQSAASPSSAQHTNRIPCLTLLTQVHKLRRPCLPQCPPMFHTT